MKKRLLSLAMVLVMCLGLLPAAAVAEGDPKLITEVAVTGFVEPQFLAHPSYDISVPENAHYHLATPEELRKLDGYSPDDSYVVNGIWWFHNMEKPDPISGRLYKIMNESSCFSDPKKDAYSASIVVIPNDGYLFAEDATFTLNGGTKLIKGGESYGTDLCFYTYDLTLPIEQITEINLSGFTEPAYGAHPDFDVIVPEGAHYHLATREEMEKYHEIYPCPDSYINGVSWESVNGSMSQTDVFSGGIGVNYRISIALVPDEGYTFDYMKDMTITLQGDKGPAKYFGQTSYLWGQCVTVHFGPYPVPIPTESTVTFEVVNGAWEDGSTDAKTVTVPLTEGRGTLTADQIPTGMKPAAGFENGSWNVTPNTDVNGVMGNVTYTYTFFTNPFIDVNEEDYFYDYVQWAVGEGITAGISPTEFGPDLKCSRAQIVTFLWNAAGQPKPEGKNPFTDVKKADWFYDAVLWAVEKDITSGIGGGKFGPNLTCSRSEAMTFLWKYLEKPAAKAKVEFTDVKESDWFYAPVQWAVEKGITAGVGGGKFGSADDCLRAQIVTFIYRALNK